MYIGRDFSPQQQGESEVFGIDFVMDLNAGEVLQSSRWFLTVVDGADPNPGKHLQGPSKVVKPLGSEIVTATIQRIGGVLPDVTYVVEAVVITSLGNTRSLWTHLRGVNTD